MKHPPFSTLALPPLTGAASKEVPRTENTFTFSSHFTVHRAFPRKDSILQKNRAQSISESQEILALLAENAV